MRIKALIVCCVQLLSIKGVLADEDNQSVIITPTLDDNFTYAAFKFWEPHFDHKINGIIALLPGWSGDGTELTDNQSWRQLASKMNCALVSCTFQSDANMPDYYLAEHGSGRALITAIEVYGLKHSWEGCDQLPIALCGHSAGGEFAFNFSRWAPKRVVAVVAIKGGFYENPDSPELFRIPILFITGQHDEGYRQNALKSLFYTGRVKNAPWCIASDHLGHEIGKAYDLAIPFIEGSFRLRNPEENVFADSTQIMEPLDLNAGILVNILGDQSCNPAEYTGLPEDMLWSPDEHFAAVLHSYNRGN